MLEIILAGLIGVLIMSGMFISLNILKFPDITCEASYAMGCSVYCYLSAIAGMSPPTCVVISALLGTFCGGITAILRMYLEVPKVVCGMITVTAVIGVLQLFPVLNYSNMFGSKFSNFAMLNLAIVAILTTMVSFALYSFIKSESGLRFKAYSRGYCETSVTSRKSWLVLASGLSVSNGIVALAGALSSQLYSSSIVYVGNGVFIFGLICLLIAELILDKNKYSGTTFFITTLAVSGVLRLSLELFETIFNINKSHSFSNVILALVAVFVYSVLTAHPSLQLRIIKKSMGD